MSALSACSGSKPAPAKPVAASALATKAPASGVDTAADRLVTSTDVEQISGLIGIKLIPRDPSKGAGGDLTFATQDDRLVLMVLVSGSSLYKPSREQKGYFHADVSGIGDEAFDGPADDQNFYTPPGRQADPFLLAFRKGARMVTLSSFLGPDQKAYLSQEKLRELATPIAARM
jgi:hypothetical protein